MNYTISDLPGDVQLTSIIALQVDSYGMSQTCDTLKHVSDTYIFSKVCSIMLSLEIGRWIRSMKPQGKLPDHTTLNLKMRDGTEMCLERHVITGDGTLKSMRVIAQQEIIERVKELYELGELGKLFIAEPKGG